MKKILLVAATVFALSGLVFAQEAEETEEGGFGISFENKISSDIVSVSDGEAGFAGITEEVSAEATSERVDAGVKLIVDFGDMGDGNYGFTGYDIDTAYIEFRPVEVLALDFNNGVSTAGSYLPVADDNVGNGNLLNDFAVQVKPIEGLTIAAGICLPSVFADTDEKIDCSAGVDYTADAFSVGATLRSPINGLGFGVFGSITAVEDLMIDLGFSYNDDFADIAGNILTAGVTYDISDISLGFDFVTNFAQEGYNMYTGLSFGIGITEVFSISASGTLTMDFDAMDATAGSAEADAIFTMGNHEIGAGVHFDIADSFGFSFPVYYSYSF